jgi:hypothetical protein
MRSGGFNLVDSQRCLSVPSFCRYLKHNRRQDAFKFYAWSDGFTCPGFECSKCEQWFLLAEQTSAKSNINNVLRQHLETNLGTKLLVTHKIGGGNGKKL